MMQPLTQETHGHEVLQMMLDSGQSYSRQSLISAIDQKFGQDCRFYICSGGNMSAAELVDALEAKGKFTGPDDAFRFDPGQMCDH